MHPGSDGTHVAAAALPLKSTRAHCATQKTDAMVTISKRCHLFEAVDLNSNDIHSLRAMLRLAVAHLVLKESMN